MVHISLSFEDIPVAHVSSFQLVYWQVVDIFLEVRTDAASGLQTTRVIEARGRHHALMVCAACKVLHHLMPRRTIPPEQQARVDSSLSRHSSK